MDKMTVFYKSNNGKIVNISSGTQDYSIFQEEERSTAIEKFDILVLDEKQDILNNPRGYFVQSNKVIPRFE